MLVFLVRLSAPPLIQPRDFEHEMDEGTGEEQEPRSGQTCVELGEGKVRGRGHDTHDDRFEEDRVSHYYLAMIFLMI